MAKQTVNVSDLSGEAIPEGSGATVRITFNGNKGRVYALDVTSDEADTWASQGTEQKRRGRKPAEAKPEPVAENPEPNVYATA